MSHLAELPEQLIALRDLAVESVRNGSPIEDMQPLYDWFQTDGWDLMADAWFNDQIAIPFKELVKTEFNDLALSEYEGIKLKEITDNHRLERARQLIDDSNEDYPSVHIYKLLTGQNDSL